MKNLIKKIGRIVLPLAVAGILAGAVNHYSLHEKKYSEKHILLMPSSLTFLDATKFTQEVVQFLDNNCPNDTLEIFILSNKISNPPYFTKLTARNSKRTRKTVENVLKDANLSVKPRIINFFYNDDIFGLNSDEVFRKILGSENYSKIYTAGHGLTTSKGFITLCSDEDALSDLEAKGFTWEDYFSNPRWLDLSCGSTSSVDPFSHRDDSARRGLYLNKDNLVRYFAEIDSHIKFGLENKKKMRKNYRGKGR
ncbi:MAG: hypothetical protein Q8P15_01960 [Nanoarchaeota archaeon]|nr:hypothetical protein [Nanoarchaeota archaeon]